MFSFFFVMARDSRAQPLDQGVKKRGRQSERTASSGLEPFWQLQVSRDCVVRHMAYNLAGLLL